jgi:CyaY protein
VFERALDAAGSKGKTEHQGKQDLAVHDGEPGREEARILSNGAHTSMADTEFMTLALAKLAALEAAIEAAADAAGVDIDLEPQAGGILKLEFEDGSQIIINRHEAAGEIWVAARAGGYHFRLNDGIWRDTRDQEALDARLQALASQQAGTRLSW